MNVSHSEDHRQRAADVLALMLLARFTMQAVEPDLARIGATVARLCAAENPENLRKYSAMTWGEAAREIKITFLQDYLAHHASAGAGGQQEAAPLQLPPTEVDEEIGNSIVAALYRFISLRKIDPDWYALHLRQMPSFDAPEPVNV